MNKPVKSSDPRKPKVVQALKEKSGCSKVTLLKEIDPGVFSGQCHKYVGGKYDNLGTFTVEVPNE